MRKESRGSLSSIGVRVSIEDSKIEQRLVSNFLQALESLVE